MDKNEYNLKLQEIEKYVDQGNYEAAAAAADTIDWKRVRNVRTLCMISEIYEAQKRFEDSKQLLLRAYKRSPVGRMILYRLVEVCIHLKQFDEAIEYYSEYVQAAPHDNNRYILKYKIYRGRGSSLDEQIKILKDYLDQEYVDKYVYELAKLYREADRIQECLTTCDDLVLWFHSGKYVIKALELKMRYAPLTPKQQEIYDHRFDEPEEEDEAETEESFLGKEKKMVPTREPDPAENIVEDTQRSIAREVAEAAQEESGSAGAAGLPQTDHASDESAGQADAVDSDAFAGRTDAEDNDAFAGRTDAEDNNAFTGQTDAADNDASAGQNRVIEEKAQKALQSTDSSGFAAQKAAEQVEERLDAEDELQRIPEPSAPAPTPEQLHTQAARNMHDIVSGIADRPTQDPDEEAEDEIIEKSKEDQEAASFARGNTRQMHLPKLHMPDLTKKAAAGQVTIDDVLLSMGERGTAVREAAARASAPVSQQNGGVLSAVDEALLNMGIRKAPQRSTDTEKRAEEIEEQKEAEEEAAKKATQAAEAAQEAAAACAAGAQEAAGDQEATEACAAGAQEAAAASAVGVQQTAVAFATGDQQTPVNSAAVSAAGAQQTAAFAAGAQKRERAAAASEKQVNGMRAEIQSDIPDQGALEEAFAEEPETEDMNSTELLKEKDTAVSAGETVSMSAWEENSSAPKEDILLAKTRVLPTEEIARLYGRRPLGPVTKEPEKEAVPTQRAQAPLQEGLGSAVAEAAEQSAPTAAQAAAAQQSAPSDMSAGQPARTFTRADSKQTGEQIPKAPAPGQTAGAPEEESAVQAKASAAQVKVPAEQEQPPAAQEERSQQPQLHVHPAERGLFDGFLNIGSLDSQIAYAIQQAVSKGQDRTSRTGNILIFGAHGSGKTTIATGLAKAIAKERGDKFVKMARIYATDLNRKDIAATIAKIAGGILIIEEAGDLEDQIADQLTTAMEFRTDGLIVIMEDEQKYIHDLLMHHPRFTMKFTSQIYVPDFTENELIRFASGYADRQQYTISQEAAAALAGKIQKLTADGEQVSITMMDEFVDEAIRRANKFGRKLFAGKKRYDDRNHIVLQARDFK